MSMPTYADVNAGDSIVLFGDSQNAREAVGWKTPIFRGEVGAENSKRTFDAQNCYWLTGAIPRCHISATRQGDPCPAAQPGQQQQAPTADLLAARAAGGATLCAWRPRARRSIKPEMEHVSHVSPQTTHDS
jgi:hypothetical protein